MHGKILGGWTGNNFSLIKANNKKLQIYSHLTFIQFYNAKVTNVSESTYVVLFYDYGNAEEVRKSDVLPLIQACPTPPHSANFVPNPQPTQAYHISQQKMPPQQQQHHQQQSYHPSSYKNHSGGMKNHQRR